jgi:hypothetical protein
MIRRRVVVGLGAIGLGLTLAVGVIPRLLNPDPPHPCLDTFARIREGMTRVEVRAAIGGVPSFALTREHCGTPMLLMDKWEADGSTLVVTYDIRNDDDVVYEAWVTVHLPLTFWIRLGARLGL